MKQRLKQLFTILFTLIILLFFGVMLLSYTVPMENLSVDLNVALPDGASPEDFDGKGWTLFTQEGDVVTELEGNGFGAYTGLELGQTFYFSRVLNEDLDAPTLQLDPGNRNFSIFLDGELIYTDCPDLDNRIGYLTLPMGDWDRMEQLTIFLPNDYHGKVLTIAQSTPDYVDATSVQALPCSVKLYCGYAYESELIAESFQTGYFSFALFIIGFLLLTVFAFKGNLESLCIGLAALLGMFHLISVTSFAQNYFGDLFNLLGTIPDYLLTGTLLLALSLQAGKGRKLMLILTGIYGIALLVGLYLQLRYDGSLTFAQAFFASSTMEWIATIMLLVVLVMGICFWRKKNSFYRLFIPLALFGELIYWGYDLMSGKDILSLILLALGGGHITFVYWKLLVPFFLSALVTAVVETIRSEVNRHMNKQLIKQQYEMTLASYDNLRTHHQEIMMLRHDMLHHFRALQEMRDGNQIRDYLTTLIGQNEKIRPVVQSGNEMLDIILNGKLGAAMVSGIKIEISKADAPKQIPMKDADLCSLVMNIVDNAIKAASRSAVQDPLIRLDIHVKSDYLMFICENTADFKEVAKENKEKAVSKHGLGLKIIQNIIKKYNGLINTEVNKDRYYIRVAIPLN